MGSRWHFRGDGDDVCQHNQENLQAVRYAETVKVWGVFSRVEGCSTDMIRLQISVSGVVRTTPYASEEAWLYGTPSTTMIRSPASLDYSCKELLPKISAMTRHLSNRR